MKNKIKQIIIIYDDGSAKGYNLNAFLKVFKVLFLENFMEVKHEKNR